MTHPVPVTLVTKDAGQPEDDAAFMRELLDLRDGLAKTLGKRPSIADMLTLLGEPASRKGFWSHRLADPPTRTTFPPEARAVIRAAVGEAPPPTPAEVVDTMVSERAAMWLIGTLEPGERVNRVLMLAGSDAIETYANGTVSAKRIQSDLSAVGVNLDIDTAPARSVESTPRPGCDSGNQNARSARKFYRPALPPELRERVEASGVDAATLIEAGLAALKSEVEGD